ncbi:MAG: class I SAM-dependent methyltransferase [Gemmatimonadetes bacterium]|nr:class I SAM-dependent methyltransferase [Gemmatimonadota bacterium]
MSEGSNVSFERYAPEGRVTLYVGSALGRRQLRRIKRAGLPEFLTGPFQFLMERTLSVADLRVVERIEGLRMDMAKRSQEFVGVFEEEAKPARIRSLTEVAWVASVLPLWGTFLYLCAKASRAKTILELGGAAGISGCYLALSPSCTRFVTIEGSSARAQLAELHLRQVASHAEVVIASFKDGLEQVLPTLHEGIDLVFLDGTRRQDATLALLSRMTPHLNPQCLVIFDDIHLSAETRETWKQICRLQGLAYAINVGRFGVCGWQGGHGRAKTGTLFGIAGIDLYRVKRRIA